MIFAGIPPGHFNRRQFDCAGAGGHQGLALLARADQAAFAGQVAQLWLIRVTPQTGYFCGRQGWQLRAGQPFGLERQGASQRIADLRSAGLRAPVFFQVDTACRQPGDIGRVVGRLGLDGQRHFGGLDPHRSARLRPERIGVLGLRTLGRRLHQRGAEHLRRYLEHAALLRVDRVACLDHPVAYAVDQLFVGARVAELFDPCVRYLQGAQAAVVEQRYRMVDAQGQHGLRLNIHAVLIQARLDKDRRQMVALLLGLALQDLQGQRLAFQLAQLQ